MTHDSSSGDRMRYSFDCVLWPRFQEEALRLIFKLFSKIIIHFYKYAHVLRNYVWVFIRYNAFSLHFFFSFLKACMILSAAYHVFCCCSEQSYRQWLTMDLLGVSLSLLAIYISGIYYAFSCVPVSVVTFLTEAVKPFHILHSLLIYTEKMRKIKCICKKYTQATFLLLLCVLYLFLSLF